MRSAVLPVAGLLIAMAGAAQAQSLTGALGALAGGTSGSDASGIIEQVMTAAYPGVDVPPYVPCVVDSVDSSDLASLAAAGTAGDMTSATDIVRSIAESSETRACFADAGLPALPN
jgi:single-stranded DNA-specific DHH superfamily exonuclease